MLLAVGEGPVGGTSIDTCAFEDPATVRLETDCPTGDFFFPLQQQLATQKPEQPKWMVVDPCSGLAREVCQKDGSGGRGQGVWGSAGKRLSLSWIEEEQSQLPADGLDKRGGGVLPDQRSGVVRIEVKTWMSRRDCDQRVKFPVWSSYRHWLWLLASRRRLFEEKRSGLSKAFKMSTFKK